MLLLSAWKDIPPNLKAALHKSQRLFAKLYGMDIVRRTGH